MEFQKIVALRGPNVWARFPVLEAWIELGDLKDSPSNEMPGFNERVMSWLPTMIEHRCSVGERGGFFERLRRGTYLAHIMEHVTLELQALAGSDFGFGRARETTKEGLFRVAVRYEDEAVCRACLEVGRRLCLAAVNDQPFDVPAEVFRLRLIADEVRMGPSTRAVVNAARERNIPIRRLSEGSLVQLGYGSRQRRIHRSATDATSAVAESISDDKELTKDYLRAAGVPVAGGRLATSAADAWQAAQEIGAEVVVKPRDANFGNGVVVGITKREQIEGAYEFAITQGSGVIVEQLAHGAEHRLLVVGGKLVAATRGNPVYVTSDGRQNMWELVESQVNSDPRRGKDFACPLSRVEVDPVLVLVLEQQGYTLESVPKAGEKVMIQRNGNLAIDVTDAVHPQVARQAETAARVMGLDVAGIDVIAEDISQPLEEQGGVVIEVNAGPGLQMHIEPESGIPRPVGEAIVATMFPPGDEGRIPIVAVLGNRHTTTVTRRIGQLLSAPGRTVGVASAEGLWAGDTQALQRDSATLAGARSLLLNPLVDVAVCEASIESVVEEGLGFDQCQVAVITAMDDGHLLDLLEGDTPEKRALVYRSASDVMGKSGVVVMRAGEPLGPIISSHCPGSVILFHPDAANPELVAHLAAGGKAVTLRAGKIIRATGTSETAIEPASPSPTSGEIDVELAAAAALWALGF